jgi:hypothetical protein
MTLADLAAAVQPLGRPTLVLESPDLPALPPAAYAWRWYHLAEQGWSGEIVEAFRELDRGWKYVDVYAPPDGNPEHAPLVGAGRPGYTTIMLSGYADEPLPLEGVLAFLAVLEARGIRVELRGPEDTGPDERVTR